jgi:hypothetical protein
MVTVCGPVGPPGAAGSVMLLVICVWLTWTL